MQVALLSVNPDDSNLVKEALYAFPRLIKPEIIGPQDVIDGVLQRFEGVVLPGGKARNYSNALGRVGAQQIRNFVESGGHYLGICAGAYYACKRIKWCARHPKHPTNAIVDKDTLGLVNATARGPIRQFADYERPTYARLVDIEKPSKRRHTSVYLGGPRFLLREGKNIEVLARYSELTKANIAIFRQSYGKGSVLLSSPHPEIFPRHIIKRHKKTESSRGQLSQSMGQLCQDERLERMNLYLLPLVINRFVQGSNKTAPKTESALAQ